MIPALPPDRVRFHVAAWKLARALGVTLSPRQTDLEIIETLAEHVDVAIGDEWRKGYEFALDSERAIRDRIDDAASKK